MAAAEHGSFQPAATAGRDLEVWLTDTTGQSLLSHEQINALTATMDEACSRARI